MNKNKFLSLTVAHIANWPEGFEYILNSKMDDVCYFFRKGEDYMEVASETPMSIPGSQQTDWTDVYSIVTQQEWTEARAIR